MVKITEKLNFLLENAG